MPGYFILTTGALLLALGVILGAFGAHGLKTRLGPELLAVWQTGVLYHLIHGLGVLMLGALVAARPDLSGLRPAAVLLALGVLLFSGSLYTLALGGPRWLGPITPLGGTLFIAGWLTLAWSAWRAGA